METGKQDSRMREQLDKLDQVPESFRFRQALVWEEVETRLQEKEKQRKPLGWLYGAAAVLLLLAGWWWLNTKKAESPVSKKTPPASNQNSTSIGLDTGQKIILPEMPVQQQQQAVNKALKQPPAVHITANNSLKQDSMAAQFYIVKTIAATDSNDRQLTALPPAGDSLLVTKAVTKPRFRTAHINELDNDRNDLLTVQQVVKKKPLLSSFRFSPKNVANDLIINENTLFVDPWPRSFLKSVQIKD